MSRSLVLLSGGLDSSYNLLKSHQTDGVALALSFSYGQRAAAREIQSAHQQCEKYGINHRVVDLSFFSSMQNSGLTNADKIIPVGSEVNINENEQSLKTASAVWVPNRNGIFLNVAAGIAEDLGIQTVITGFNAEEAATFPDNSQDFLRSAEISFQYSTRNHVKLFCYSIAMNKTEIIEDALKIGLDFALLWPCYFSEEKWCGQCESCLRFKRALKSNHIDLSERFHR